MPTRRHVALAATAAIFAAAKPTPRGNPARIPLAHSGARYYVPLSVIML
jgi:hypothetical protein